MQLFVFFCINKTEPAERVSHGFRFCSEKGGATKMRRPVLSCGEKSRLVFAEGDRNFRSDAEAGGDGEIGSVNFADVFDDR